MRAPSAQWEVPAAEGRRHRRRAQQARGVPGVVQQLCRVVLPSGNTAASGPPRMASLACPVITAWVVRVRRRPARGRWGPTVQRPPQQRPASCASPGSFARVPPRRRRPAPLPSTATRHRRPPSRALGAPARAAPPCLPRTASSAPRGTTALMALWLRSRARAPRFARLAPSRPAHAPARRGSTVQRRAR